MHWGGDGGHIMSFGEQEGTNKADLYLTDKCLHHRIQFFSITFEKLKYDLSGQIT